MLIIKSSTYSILFVKGEALICFCSDFSSYMWFLFFVSETPVTRLPIMAKSVLDLYELYKLVVQRGGLVDVINKKLWQEVIKGLNLPSSITSAAFTLRTQWVYLNFNFYKSVYLLVYSSNWYLYLNFISWYFQNIKYLLDLGPFYIVSVENNFLS